MPSNEYFVSQAHLKSEINYNWEKNMQIGGNRKPILRRKEHNVASRFFGFASRGKKLKWVSINS